MMLKGAARLLAHHSPLLLIEVHHILRMFEIQKLLTGLGYELELLDEANAWPSRCFVLGRKRGSISAVETANGR
jgi:hypothetical protein